MGRSAPILTRKDSLRRGQIRVAEEVRDELEIYKIRHRLRSTEAAAHVVLCRALKLDRLLPEGLDAATSS